MTRNQEPIPTPYGMKRHFKIGRDRIVHEGKFLRTIHRGFIGTKGEKEMWEMVEKKVHGNSVGIVPITKKNEVVLVKIYRMASKSWVWEFPAGLNDKKGESEISIARRELLEETGYTAKKFERLVQGPLYAGLLSEEIAFYLARGAEKIKEPEHENAEDIEVITIPLSRFYYYLTHPPKGLVIDIKIYGILYLLKRKGYTV